MRLHAPSRMDPPVRPGDGGWGFTDKDQPTPVSPDLIRGLLAGVLVHCLGITRAAGTPNIAHTLTS